MTSQTSSNKPKPQKNTGLFSFASSFGIGPVLANVTALAFLMFYYMGYTANHFLSRLHISNPKVVYSLMNKYNGNMLFAVLVIQAMVTAVLIFGFMFNKRAASTYLSLPINRGKLFITKYAAGLILICIPILIFMTLMLIANIQTFGYSTVLMQGFFLLTGAALVALFTAYSITSAVCLFAGTVIEGLVFTVFIIFSPVLITSGTTWIFHFFLRGNTFGETYEVLTTELFGLNHYISPYMPSFISMSLFETYSDNYGDPLNIPFFHERFDGAVMLVVWVLLSGLICFLAYRAFKRYKAENSGVLGTNKTLNLASAFTVVYFIFAFFLTAVNATNIFLLMSGFLISMAAFVLCRFLFTLSVRETFSFTGLRQFVGIMGVTGFVCLLSYTGLFRYSSRLPNFNDIKSVAITYAGVPDFILGESREFGNYRFPYRDSVGQDNYTRDFYDLQYTSENDIKTVMELHKELANAKPRLFGNNKQSVDDPEKDMITYQVHIKYLLKDGTIFERQYKYVTAKTAIILLKLDGTDAVTERITESFAALSKMEDIQPVLITDSLFENEYLLDPAYNPVLFEALAKDIEGLAPEAKYFPENPALAIISFPRLKPDGSYESVSLGANFRSLTTSEAAENMNMYSVSTAIMRLYITDEYINTMAFLNDREIQTNEPTDTEIIKAMYVQRYYVNSLIYPTQAMYFRSYASFFYESGSYGISGALAIDKNEYAHILDLSKNHYYIAEGGYLVKVLTTVYNGVEKWTTLFLPESVAPDYIKNQLKK